MNGPTLNAPIPQASTSHEAASLEPAVNAARELSRRLAELPEGAPEARHPSYGIARALALTLVDMLDEISRDKHKKGDSGRKRHGHR